MHLLFQQDPLFPPGFSYRENFITEDEEKKLLDYIGRLKLHAFKFHGFMARRMVASFGYDWSFTRRELSKGEKIPDPFGFLIERTGEEIDEAPSHFSELLVSRYPPGSVINWHRDAPPFDVIAGISLQADCTFRLRPYGKLLRTRKSVVSIPVSRRSLYVMVGPSRIEWEHCILPVTQERFSITLRTMRNKAL